MQISSFRPATRLFLAGAALALPSAAGLAQGTPPTVTATPSDAGIVSEPIQGEMGWIISILATKDTGATPLEFDIVGDDTTIIEKIQVQRQIEYDYFEGHPACIGLTVAFGSSVRLSIGDGGTGLGVKSILEIIAKSEPVTVGCVGLGSPGGGCPCTELPTEWHVDIASLHIDGDLGALGQQSPAISDIRVIEFARIRGDMLAPIELDLTDPGTEIIDLQVIGGNIEASISSVSIESLVVTDGRIGRGEGKEDEVIVRTLGSIGVLSAGSISATIESGTSTNRMPIGRIETTGDNLSQADVSGWIRVKEIESSLSPTLPAGMFIQGGLIGTVELTEPLESPIWIDLDLFPSAVIELPALGLRSQIIVNRSGGSGWDGVVKVGTIELDTSDYDALPIALAGTGADGSAGLAPYSIHHAASTPVDEGVVFVTALDIGSPGFDCDPINPVKVRMYGPVTLNGTDPHFDVLTKDGSGVYNVDAGFNAFAEIVPGTDARTLKIIPDTAGNVWPFDDFAIVRLYGKVKARDVVDTPTITADLHRFTTADGCGLMLLQNYDQNSDNTLCVQDIAAWTTTPTDLDGDEDADGDDCARLLQAINMFNSLND